MREASRASEELRNELEVERDQLLFPPPGRAAAGTTTSVLRLGRCGVERGDENQAQAICAHKTWTAVPLAQLQGLCAVRVASHGAQRTLPALGSIDAASLLRWNRTRVQHVLTGRERDPAVC